MRRIDLAEKIGLTASGVTRILLPMEKVGLIKSDLPAKDARVKCVVISKSGQNKIEETIERLNDIIEEKFFSIKETDLKKLSNLLIEIGGRILIN